MAGGAKAGRQGDIQLTLSDGTVYDHPGKVHIVDRAVDPTTATLGVQLLYPNPDLLLRPGQYGRARVLLENRAGHSSCSSGPSRNCRTSTAWRWWTAAARCRSAT